MEVEIVSLDHYGRGVSRLNDKIVFVKNALVGERVKIKVTKEKKDITEAQVVEYITKSEARIVPKCPYYGTCGGCNLMHMNYNEQLEFKKNKVEEVLKKFADVEFKIDRIISSKEFYYRNKITLQVQEKVGLYKENSFEIVPIDACLICNEKINEVIKKLKKLDLKNIGKIVIKVTNLNEIMIIFYLTGEVDETIFASLKEKNISIVKHYENKYEVLFGNDYITEVIGDYKFNISADSFFQVNTKQAIEMFEVIKNNIDEADTLLDLYCGTGTIGISLSKNVKRIIGIEVNRFAIEDAIKNAKINSVNNIEFLCGKVENLIDKVNDVDTIVVDPPRSGLDKVTIDNILRLNVKKLIYVSCDPVTLARDLKVLKEKYNIKNITLIDMFPNTHHVESVVSLEIKE